MRLHLVVEASDTGTAVARLGLNLAARLGADVLLHCPVPDLHIEGGSLPALEAAQATDQVAARVLDVANLGPGLAWLQERGLVVEEVVTRDEEPLEAILRLVGERDSALVVIGSHGRGAIARALGGSLVADVIRACPVPVVVCREDMQALPAPAAAAQTQP